MRSRTATCLDCQLDDLIGPAEPVASYRLVGDIDGAGTTGVSLRRILRVPKPYPCVCNDPPATSIERQHLHKCYNPPLGSGFYTRKGPFVSQLLFVTFDVHSDLTSGVDPPISTSITARPPPLETAAILKHCMREPYFPSENSQRRSQTLSRPANI
jgi:hypothetical protein